MKAVHMKSGLAQSPDHVFLHIRNKHAYNKIIYLNITIFDLACGLNSKQLESRLLDSLRSEQTLAVEYTVEPKKPRAI